ncbi:hypothetical protein GJR96_00645 [Haloferax sp. MBLA0076]|uniref:Uncharacterized protein n=1 Tax=Haloferax litoreum TaxID=2666140 RepID=A0A6A8GE86_9EURY|nr:MULTISPECIES: hypothetical protein [Haloferax]KAB1192025.1 hypothetical protein Hfx1148_00645 [Haloferax sp. CBA1148]MRX20467.1 hypothetical protein [Haloferax litoreum]
MTMDKIKQTLRESDHPLAEMYRKRVKQNRDLVVLITDSSNDRGTGKTTFALRLAHGMDRTEEGLTTEKVAIDPRPMSVAYTQQPRGSSLVLDESEVGMDKYRSGSAINKAIRELVATGRVEQKYLIMNAPADHLVDGDLKSLVDVWILVERRGFANVFRMDWNPHAGHPMTRSMGTLEWDPIPKSHSVNSVYKHLTEEKESRLRGKEGDGFIQRSEAKEMVDNAKQEVETELRNGMICDMVEVGIPQGKVGEAVGLSRSRISQIYNQRG